MVAREGCLGTLKDVLDTPIFAFVRVCIDLRDHYPSHIVLSQIAKGLSGTDGDGALVKQEWDDDIDDWPPGYDHGMDLSQEEAWRVWMSNGNRWV